MALAPKIVALKSKLWNDQYASTSSAKNVAQMSVKHDKIKT